MVEKVDVLGSGGGSVSSKVGDEELSEEISAESDDGSCGESEDVGSDSGDDRSREKGMGSGVFGLDDRLDEKRGGGN